MLWHRRTFVTEIKNSRNLKNTIFPGFNLIQQWIFYEKKKKIGGGDVKSTSVT